MRPATPEEEDRESVAFFRKGPKAQRGNLPCWGVKPTDVNKDFGNWKDVPKRREIICICGRTALGEGGSFHDWIGMGIRASWENGKHKV